MPRDGARIACACLRHGDSKDRKVVLKALKGFVARAAQDVYGALVLCAALAFIDDTVLLAKSVLAELQPELVSLALQPQGCLPLLQLLAPRSSSHFTPEQLAIIGEPDGTTSVSAVRPRPTPSTTGGQPPRPGLPLRHPFTCLGRGCPMMRGLARRCRLEEITRAAEC